MIVTQSTCKQGGTELQKKNDNNNSKHLYDSYYVPRPLARILHMLMHLIRTKIP